MFLDERICPWQEKCGWPIQPEAAQLWIQNDLLSLQRSHPAGLIGTKQKKNNYKKKKRT